LQLANLKGLSVDIPPRLFPIDVALPPDIENKEAMPQPKPLENIKRKVEILGRLKADIWIHFQALLLFSSPDNGSIDWTSGVAEIIGLNFSTPQVEYIKAIFGVALEEPPINLLLGSCLAKAFVDIVRSAMLEIETRLTQKCGKNEIITNERLVINDRFQLALDKIKRSDWISKVEAFISHSLHHLGILSSIQSCVDNAKQYLENHVTSYKGDAFQYIKIVEAWSNA